MRRCAVLLMVGLSSCTPGINGQLKTADGNLAVTKDAKVNVTRLDVVEGSEEQQPAVFIGDVNPDGTFAVTIAEGDGTYLVEAVVPGYSIVSQKIILADGNTVTMQVEPVGRPDAGMIGINMEADTGVGSGGATLTPPKL